MTIKGKLPPFDTATLGAVATARPDIASRLLHGFLLQVIGTGAPTVAEYIEYILVNQNNRQKVLIKPVIQALLDSVLNANGDTLDTSMIYIPFTRPGMNFSPWGTRDIQELSLQCKIAAANPGGKTLTKIQGWYAYTPVDNPQPRGDVFLQTVIPSGTPVAGWNTLANVPFNDIITATKMVLGHAAVTEAKVRVGDREVFNMTKAAAKEGLARNPGYKAPSTMNFFPVILDDLGLPSDFIPLVEGGVRRPLDIEYFWDTDVEGTPVAFDILLEGVERGAPVSVTAAKA